MWHLFQLVIPPVGVRSKFHGSAHSTMNTHDYISEPCIRSASTVLQPEPQSAGGASLLRDHLCETVVLPLYRDKRWHSTPSRDNWRPAVYVAHLMCWRTEGTFTTAGAVVAFSWFWRRIYNCILTYLQVEVDLSVVSCGNEKDQQVTIVISRCEIHDRDCPTRITWRG